MNHPHRALLPHALAHQAARDLIASVTAPDRQWTIETAAGCLPPGWSLSEAADDAAFRPLSVGVAAAAFRQYARRVR